MDIVKLSYFLLLFTIAMWVTVMSFSHSDGLYQSVGKRFVFAFPTIKNLPQSSLAAITVNTGSLTSVSFYVLAPLIRPREKIFGVTSRDFPFNMLLPASYRHTTTGLMNKGVLLVANDFVTVWGHIHRNSLYKNMFLALPAIALDRVYTFPMFGPDLSTAATNPSLLIIGIEQNSSVEVGIRRQTGELHSWVFPYGSSILKPGRTIVFNLSTYETFLINNRNDNVGSFVWTVKSDKYIGVLQFVGRGYHNSSTSFQAVSFMYPDVTAGKMYIIPHSNLVNLVHILMVSLEDNTVINIIGLASEYRISQAFDCKYINLNTPPVPTVLNSSSFFVANVLMTSLKEEVAMTPAMSVTLFPQIVSFTVPKEIKMAAYIVFNKSAVMFLKLDEQSAASNADLKTGKDYIGINRNLDSGFHLLYRHSRGMPFSVYLVTLDFLAVVPAQMLLSKVRAYCVESIAKHDADTVDNDCDGEVDEDSLKMEGDDRSLGPVLVGKWSMWSELTCSSMCNMKGKWERTRHCQNLETNIHDTHYVCIGIAALRERNECDYSSFTCPLNCIAGFYGYNCSHKCPVGCAAKDCNKITGNCYDCSNVLSMGARCADMKIEGYITFVMIPVVLFVAINAKSAWINIVTPCMGCLKNTLSKVKNKRKRGQKAPKKSEK